MNTYSSSQNQRQFIAHLVIKIGSYGAMTGRQFNLSRLHIFWSQSFTRKPGYRSTKLEHSKAIKCFVSFTTTNDYIRCIDTKLKKVQIEDHFTFDEGFMAKTASKVPLAAEIFQR